MQNGDRYPVGHRSCPKCQNHEASQWIDRQQAKLLPVQYFFGNFHIALSTEVINPALSKKQYFLSFFFVLPAP